MARHSAAPSLATTLITTLLVLLAQMEPTHGSPPIQRNVDFAVRGEGTSILHGEGLGGWALVGVMLFDDESECSATLSFTYKVGSQAGSSALTTELPVGGSCTYTLNDDGTGQVILELVSSPDIGFTDYVMNVVFYSSSQFYFSFFDSGHNLVGSGDGKSINIK